MVARSFSDFLEAVGRSEFLSTFRRATKKTESTFQNSGHSAVPSLMAREGRDHRGVWTNENVTNGRDAAPVSGARWPGTGGRGTGGASCG